MRPQRVHYLAWLGGERYTPYCGAKVAEIVTHNRKTLVTCDRCLFKLHRHRRDFDHMWNRSTPEIAPLT